MWNAYATADVVGEIDTVDYSAQFQANLGMTSGIRVNMTLAEFQVTNDGFGSRDTLVSIEKIIGTEFADEFNVAGSLKIIDGGDEIDRVSFSSSNVAVQIDLNQTTQHGGIAEGVQLTSIEEVVTGGGFDTIYLRNTGSTKAWGGGGIDVVYGGNGENTVWGQAGNDTYYHRGGRSTFYGEGNTDTLNMAFASGDEFFFDWANGTVDRHRAITGDAEIKFSLVENFFGSEADDTFLFGNEAMAYTGSKVTFDGKGGSNTLDFSRVTGSVGIKLNKDAASDPTAIAVDNRTSMKFLNIENIIGTDTDDFLVLLNGMKTINGRDGFDVLDISRWTEGDSIFYLETGKSVLTGNGLTLESIESFITRAGQMGIVGTSGIENFTETSGGDRFWGRGGNDVFNRSSGVDQFWGEGGNDTFYSKAGDFVDGGNDYDILHLRQEGNGYGTSHMANFKNIEEVHIEGATLVNAIFDGSIEKLYSSPWGSSYIKFTDGSKDREVYTGDKNDNIQFWGGGFVDGGGGDNWLDLRKMNGLVWDQAASEFHWGDRTIKYVNIQHFQYNSKRPPRWKRSRARAPRASRRASKPLSPPIPCSTGMPTRRRRSVTGWTNSPTTAPPSSSRTSRTSAGSRSSPTTNRSSSWLLPAATRRSRRSSAGMWWNPSSTKRLYGCRRPELGPQKGFGLEGAGAGADGSSSSVLGLGFGANTPIMLTTMSLKVRPWMFPWP